VRIPLRPLAAALAASAGFAAGGCASSSKAEPDAGPPPPDNVVTVFRNGGREIAMSSARDDAARDVYVDAPAARVWEAVPIAYRRMGLEITASDPTRGELSTEYYRARARIGRARISTYVDCGSGALGLPNADNYQINFRAVTRLYPDSLNHKTTVRTILRATAKADGVSGDPVACLTTGELERLIGQYTTEALAAVKP
jgi:hypothetical protein